MNTEDPNTFVCGGCSHPIVNGQHYMDLVATFATRFDNRPPPVVEVEPTVLRVRVHDATCFALWGLRNPIHQNVFG